MCSFWARKIFPDSFSVSYDRCHKSIIAYGIFAYAKNDSMSDYQRAHKYCCNCFDNYKKSTLQQFQPEGHCFGLSCHNGCPDLLFEDYLGSG